MMKPRSMRVLAIVFFISGLYDTLEGSITHFWLAQGVASTTHRRTLSMPSLLLRFCFALPIYNFSPLST